MDIMDEEEEVETEENGDDDSDRDDSDRDDTDEEDSELELVPEDVLLRELVELDVAEELEELDAPDSSSQTVTSSFSPNAISSRKVPLT